MASSSSSKPRPNEVFISFRGEDTRNKFVSHLLSALKDRGIRTYFDEDNLEKGQTIPNELMKAIQESSIAIVVLSTNYSSSKWCLNELLEIMECKHKPGGLEVIPIFYNVDPSDVRHQTNTFEKAFLAHVKNVKVNAEIVKRWREALTEVANLKGDHITEIINEAECIKKTTLMIINRLQGKDDVFREIVVGIKTRISEIKELICTEPNEVLFIGIRGMGGIGKTTTARAIYEDCKTGFDGYCFLGDVGRNEKTPKDLQRTLLSEALNINIENIRDGYQRRLQLKRVFLVIDDVNDREQLNVLAKQPDWFGPGSRIIITTRDEQLLNEDHIIQYDIQTLPQDEALQLLCMHAFRETHPPENYIELSIQVLRYADGLPLALVVIGCYLYKREKCTWQSTLEKLKNIPKQNIISILRIGFDGLDESHQNLFLNIACFFKGRTKGSVKGRLESLGLDLDLQEGICVLIQKSLIYTRKDRILMHDLLQEMGWHIIYQEGDGHPEKYSRLWFNKDIVHVLSKRTVISEAKGICMPIYYYPLHADLYTSVKAMLNRKVLNFPEPGGNLFNRYVHFSRSVQLVGSKLKNVLVDRQAQPVRRRIQVFSGTKGPGEDLTMAYTFGWSALRNMTNLYLLELQGDFFNGNYDVNNSDQDEVFPSLRWFFWSQYPGQSLPKCFHPHFLTHLHMEKSQIKETPDFSLMPNLEVLNLSHSRKLVDVHSSLGDHMKIKHINLLKCIELEKFPKINEMKSLEILDLSFTKLKYFPEIYGNLSSLKKLKLSYIYINAPHLPIMRNATSLRELELRCNYETSYINGPPHQPMMGNSTSVQELFLRWSTPWSVFKRLEVEAKRFPGLVSLKLIGTGIVRTPDFTDFRHLEILEITSSRELEEVHASLGVHKKIKSINLSCCPRLKEFPGIVDMDALEYLDLSVTSLQSFPEMTGNVNRLKNFCLDSTEIMTLPWSIGRATSVEIISIKDCKYLGTLPISLIGLQFLKEVYIWSGGQQLIFPQGRGQLPGPHISFNNCISLHKLPSRLLSWVKSLFIRGCPILSRGICSQVVNLLVDCQNLHILRIHEESELDFFLESELMSNMLRKRQEFFKVYFPRSQIPSWLKHKFSRQSMTVFLPPLSKWYTDKFRGFVLSGINADLTTNSFLSQYDDLDDYEHCCCPRKLHVVVMYIPVNNIRGNIEHWDRQQEYTLFELQASPYRDGTPYSSEQSVNLLDLNPSTNVGDIELIESFPGWGLSLVYSEGQVDVVDPQNQILETIDFPDDYSEGCTFRVKIAREREEA